MTPTEAAKAAALRCVGLAEAAWVDNQSMFGRNSSGSKSQTHCTPSNKANNNVTRRNIMWDSGVHETARTNRIGTPTSDK